MINKVILVGHLGGDPEIKRFEDDKVVANFSLATSSGYKNKASGEWISNTEWHNIAAWAGSADYAEKYLKRGMLIYLEGKLQTSRYTDKDGIEKSTTKIVANTIRILERKSNSKNIESSNETPGNDPGIITSTAGDSAEDDLPF